MDEFEKIGVKVAVLRTLAPAFAWKRKPCEHEGSLPLLCTGSSEARECRSRRRAGARG
jgi:hypothetical protein